VSKVITLVLLLPIVFVVSIVLASEFGGEVVDLETHDERGGTNTTSLWVVDLYGESWLRGGSRASTWVIRLEQDPEVHLTRKGRREAYRAEIVEDFSGRINDGMRAKYGLADQLISLIHDDEGVVAIRLLDH
jgi:hypothetical protein